MHVYQIQKDNAPAVAGLMAAIKPEWWNREDALDQLLNETALVKLVGWYLADDASHPRGWILCAEYPGYACLSIECLGFDEGGKFVMEAQLQALLERARTYAAQKGYRNLKYIIGSQGLSCHGRPVTDYAEALEELHSCGRAHFEYFAAFGFSPAGIIPNCYGENYHGILMILPLLDKN